MARRTFFALLAIFSWFFAIFSGQRRFFRWVMTVFWSCGWSFGVRGFSSVVAEDFLRGDGEGRAGSGRGLAIRHSGDVLLGGASGAGSLLLNTKASQEAACSRAPAAIVPVRA